VNQLAGLARKESNMLLILPIPIINPNLHKWPKKEIPEPGFMKVNI